MSADHGRYGRPVSARRARPVNARTAYRAQVRQQREQILDQRAAARAAEGFRWAYHHGSALHPDRSGQPTKAILGVRYALGGTYRAAEELVLGGDRINTLHALAECAQLPAPDGPAERRRTGRTPAGKSSARRARSLRRAAWVAAGSVATS